MEPGQILLTGALGRMVPAVAGDCSADYGKWGTIELQHCAVKRAREQPFVLAASAVPQQSDFAMPTLDSLYEAHLRVTTRANGRSAGRHAASMRSRFIPGAPGCSSSTTSPTPSRSIRISRPGHRCIDAPDCWILYRPGKADPAAVPAARRLLAQAAGDSGRLLGGALRHRGHP